MTAQPYHHALAIAQLGRERVFESAEYLTQWDYLARAGVDLLTVRHVLDRAKKPGIEALDMVERWCRAGDSTLALAGRAGSDENAAGYGAGKSFAGATWLLWLRRTRGVSSMWVDCAAWGRMSWREQIVPMLARMEATPALVIDDLGAGQSAHDSARRELNAVLQSRIGACRPTLLTTNDTPDELARYVTPRILDRFRMGGGIHSLRPQPSLRADDPDKAHAQKHAGRGRRYVASLAIVEMMGHERVVDGEPRVGHLLVRRVESQQYARIGVETGDPCKRAIAILALDAGEVSDLATQLEANDPTTELERELAVKLADLPLAVQARKIRDNQERAESCYSVVRDPKGFAAKLAAHRAKLEQLLERRGVKPKKPRPKGPGRAVGGSGAPSQPAPRRSYWSGIDAGPIELPGDTKGIKARLGPLGFQVTGKPGRYKVERVSGEGKAKRRAVLATSLATEVAGWQRAAELVSL